MFVENDVCVKLLDDWGLQVPDQTTRIIGRTLPPEQLFFGNDRVDHGSAQADWSRAATNLPMLEVVCFLNMLLFYYLFIYFVKRLHTDRKQSKKDAVIELFVCLTNIFTQFN